MRLVDSSTACHNNETRVSWNITGRDQRDPQDPRAQPAQRDRQAQLDRPDQQDLPDRHRAGRRLFGHVHRRITRMRVEDNERISTSSMEARRQRTWLSIS